MSLRNIVVSTCIAGIVGITLFLYFKNRLTNVENKLDIVFKLIQTHNNDNTNSISVNELKTDNEQINNLINVSENEYCGTDSDSDSDSDSDNDNDSNSEYDSDNNNVLQMNKHISNDNNNVNAHNLMHDTNNILNLDIQPLEYNSLEISKNENIIDNNDDIDVDTINKYLTNNDTDNVDNDEDNNDVNNEDNNDDNDITNMNTISIEGLDTEDTYDNKIKQYNLYKVNKLKEIARNKGLENFGKLRKAELIKFIINNE